jgi:hypothetical protein
MKTNWYRLSAEDTLKQLGCEPASGLASAEAQQRLAKYGLTRSGMVAYD